VLSSPTYKKGNSEMTVYYAAVDGDPLTSEEGSYVIAQGRTRRIADESGRLRGGAVIGDFAFCTACESTGEITYGVHLTPGRRPKDRGRDWALGGDRVLCQCSTSPIIYPAHGRRCRVFDHAPITRFSSSNASAEPPVPPDADHWISFTLREPESYEGMSCVTRFADGSSERGSIGGGNNIRFARSNTSACTRIEIAVSVSPTEEATVSQALLSIIRA
jgi:hypothetical protein